MHPALILRWNRVGSRRGAACDDARAFALLARPATWPRASLIAPSALRAHDPGVKWLLPDGSAARGLSHEDAIGDALARACPGLVDSDFDSERAYELGFGAGLIHVTNEPSFEIAAPPTLAQLRAMQRLIPRAKMFGVSDRRRTGDARWEVFNNDERGWRDFSAWVRIGAARGASRGGLGAFDSPYALAPRFNAAMGLALAPRAPRAARPPDGVARPAWLRRWLTAERHANLERELGVPLGEALGCGHFGCVFASASPWVVKLTRDPTEGPVFRAIEEWQRGAPYEEDGVVVVATVRRVMPDAIHRGRPWPVYAIVREEVAPLVANTYGTWSAYTRERVAGRTEADREYLERTLRMTERALNIYRLGAQDWWAARRARWGRPDAPRVEEAEDRMVTAVGAMQGEVGDYLGSFLAAMLQRGMPLRDVHLGNVGWRVHREVAGRELHPGLVVFDPGHTPTDEAYEIVEVRANQARRALRTGQGHGR